MGAPFPHEPDQLTAEWIGEQLGVPVTSFTSEQIGVGVGLLGRLYRLTLTSDGAPATVIAKFPTLDEGARMHVAGPLGFYANEVAFYNDAAQHTPVATPNVYFAGYDEATGDFVLLIEDIGARRCVDQTIGCQTDDARVAIDALAALHARWWESDFAAIPWIKSYVDPPYPQVIAGMYKQAWPVALELLGGRMSDPIRDFGDRFADLVPWFLEEATQPPHTLCHGDFRLDNLFFASGEDDPPVTVVDWQICFRGNAGYDLGYFLSQSLATDVRRACQDELIDRYLDALAKQGIDVARTDLERGVRANHCVLLRLPRRGRRPDRTHERPDA